MTKPTKWHVRPGKTLISLDIRPVWSETSLSTWRKLGSLATHWAHSKDSDQTGRMPRLIWVFAGRTVILLVLSCGDLYSLCFVYFCCFNCLCILYNTFYFSKWVEHNKPTKSHESPAKTQISVNICPVGSESSLASLLFAIGSYSFFMWPMKTDQTVQISKLIGVMHGHSDNFTGFVLFRPKYLCPQLRRSWRGILVSGVPIHSSKTMQSRLLKFHIRIPHGKIAHTCFFLVWVISLSGVMPLWKIRKKSDASHILWTVHARVLKFHILWIPHGKVNVVFFSCPSCLPF